MFEQVSLNLPQSICNEFRLALKQGSWTNGLTLTHAHRKTCEQALFYREDINDLTCRLQ
ncbi:DUF1315 domain-containing protein [Pseudoalteromonas sp. NBT06-2]|uniref:DUF1315 domain-containing protein n=1 Tax=Pseudoalteromonas sp. NBT06-2 TaxID=2025950 RepID=UPI000BA5A323|nr:DUF1315 domain-containing protein [Pseudoalteromonas sp. NBT06-2]